MQLTKEQKETLKMVRTNYREMLIGFNICPKCQVRQLEEGYKECAKCRTINFDGRCKGDG